MKTKNNYKEITVPYTLNDSFSAIKRAMTSLKEYQISHYDEKVKTIYLEHCDCANLGEKIGISLEKNDELGTNINIFSAHDFCLDNRHKYSKIDVSKVLEYFSFELNNYSQSNYQFN